MWHVILIDKIMRIGGCTSDLVWGKEQASGLLEAGTLVSALLLADLATMPITTPVPVTSGPSASCN